MDQFEAAKAKLYKNRERREAYWERRHEREAAQAETPEKKEPQQAVLLTPKQPKQVMEVKISGPHEMQFRVHYGGTLLSSQQTEPEMRRLIRKQLSALGMVE